MKPEPWLEALLVDASDVRVWDLTEAAVFMRAAYGKGYQDALEEPAPDLRQAHLREREAWALLPL